MADKVVVSTDSSRQIVVRSRLLKRRCFSLLRGLSARLASIDGTQFPTAAGPATRDLLTRFLSCIENRATQTSDSKILFLAAELIDSLDYEVGYLELATTANAPRTISLLIEDSKAKLGLDGEFIVAPNAECNYMVEDIANNLFRMTRHFLSEQDLQLVFGIECRPVYVVSFPRTAKSDVLTHAILGHEIGHTIANRFILADQDTEEFRQETERSAKEVRDLAVSNGVIDEDEQFEFVEDYLGQIERVRDRAIVELVSDIVGAHLFGPAALFALNEFLSYESLDLPPSPEEYYPPFRYRIRVGLQSIRSLGYLAEMKTLSNRPVFKTMKSFLEYLENVSKDTGDEEIIESDHILRIAYDYVRKALPRAEAFVKKSVGTATYKSKNIRSDIPELVTRLLLGVPPNEIGIPPKNRPVDWRSSILAGWICFHEFSIGSDPEKAKESERITELTMLAIDYANTHTRYISELSGEDHGRPR